jgi:hypothetical protein
MRRDILPTLSTDEEAMVLTNAELVTSLQNEVRILLHLAGKVDADNLDYRPTPGQRSTLELLQYMTIMGPALVTAIKSGGFDPAAWTAAEESAKLLSFNEAVAAIEKQSATYQTEVGGMSEKDLRAKIEMFGSSDSRGSWLVNMVLSGHAAYRTQLFLYLKAGGREELNTMNLWAGIDQPAPA